MSDFFFLMKCQKKKKNWEPFFETNIGCIFTFDSKVTESRLVVKFAAVFARISHSSRLNDQTMSKTFLFNVHGPTALKFSVILVPSTLKIREKLFSF